MSAAMELHPRHDRHALTDLRRIATTSRGREMLRAMLETYRARRSLMTPRDQAIHDIAAARVRHALSEHARGFRLPPDGGRPVGERAA